MFDQSQMTVIKSSFWGLDRVAGVMLLPFWDNIMFRDRTIMGTQIWTIT